MSIFEKYSSIQKPEVLNFFINNMVSKNINDLTAIPNIGKILADKLHKVGILNEHDLKTTGSENAIIKIGTLENSGACINMLYALEGAVQGIRWHGLSKDKKQELREFYNSIKNKFE